MDEPDKDLWTISRYEDAVSTFGGEQDNNATVLCRLLLQNGAAQVVVIPATGGEKTA